MKNLWCLEEGASATIKIVHFTEDHGVGARLSDLGFTPDRHVVCLIASPMGGPKIFQVGQSAFSLEKQIAEQVEVK